MHHDGLWDNNSGEYDLSCFRDRFDLTLRDFWKIIPIERMIRDRHRLRLLSGRCIGKRTQTDPLDRRHLRQNFRPGNKKRFESRSRDPDRVFRVRALRLLRR